MKKKISIIIPTFNSAKFIKYTISSILKQDYQKWEVIICDNNSSDDTLQKIKKLVKSDNRFKFLIKKDNGVADALNNGFKVSSGKILCWLNSDDIFYNIKTLSIANKFINKTCKFINGNFLNIDSKGKVLRSFYSYLPNYKIKKYFFYNQIFTGSFFFSKDIFNSFGKFNEKYKYSFEYELITFCLKNYRGKHINEFLSCFRILPNSLSSNKKELKDEFFEILKKEKLVYINSLILRIYGFYISKNLIYAFLNRLYDKNKGKLIC